MNNYYKKGRVNYWKGKKRPKELNEHLSKVVKAKNLRGDKVPGWKGGCIAYWKEQAKKRDNYTCQVCGLREPEIMEVDRIIPASVKSEAKNSLENMMTLCPNDHRRKAIKDRKKYNFSHVWKQKLNLP